MSITFYLIGCLMVLYLVCDSEPRSKRKIIFFTFLSCGILVPVVIYSVIVTWLRVFAPHLFIYYYLDECFDKRQALTRYAMYKLYKKGMNPFTPHGYDIVFRFLRRYL